MIKYHYEDRADIYKSVIKIVASVLGSKKKFNDDDKIRKQEKLETLQDTQKIDMISKGHLEKLKELRRE